MKFHRYVPNFVIQGGCPSTRDLDSDQVVAAAGNRLPDGHGRCKLYHRQEYTTNPNLSRRRRIAMARSMNPDSAGSQFYLCLGPQHNLDCYTVFGQTIRVKTSSRTSCWRRHRNHRNRTPTKRRGHAKRRLGIEGRTYG
ncbi:MAG: peptidylprolyl isomerase [Eggerthellaceae bacterium]